jgi:serine/threonine protein kinase
MMMIPQLLVGRYEVGRLVGSGGMAEVYEGQDRLLGRRVAIKVLRSQYASDPAFLERFRREAQSAAAFSHPNIVAVYDTGMEGAIPFMVMEYVQGRTLKDAIAAEGGLPSFRAAEIGAQVAAALAAAHLRGLVHRDVKPANIILTADGTAKVTDFGIARVETASPLTQPAAVVGTAQYIAPEQAEGRTVDGRSDIYSLGCVLYELLTGQVPFTGATPVAIAYRHVQDQVVPPRLINPNVPAELEAVVLRAMAKSPDHRYQTAAQLAADLDRAKTTPLFATTPGAAASAEQATQYLAPTPTQVAPHGSGPGRAGAGRGPAGPAATRVLSTPINPAPVGASRAARYGDATALSMPSAPRRGRTVLLVAGGLLFTALLTLAVASMVIKTVSGGGNGSGTTQTTLAAALPTVEGPSTTNPPITTSAPLIASTTTPSSTIAPSTTTAASSSSTNRSSLVSVPDVVGEFQQAAVQRLQQAGFQVNVLSVPSRPRFNGRVIKEFPRAGTQLQPGSTVALWVGHS